MDESGQNGVRHTRATERLTAVESHVAGMETRLDGVEKTLSAHGRKLDAIANAVASKRGFEPGLVLSFIKDIAILIGLGGGAIIYVATNIADKPVSLLDQRIRSVEKKIDELKGINTERPK